MPVAGWQSDRFPAFYLRDGGAAVPWRYDDATQAATAFRANSHLGIGTGMLVTNPIPADAELDPEWVQIAIDDALRKVGDDTGPDVTPQVLDALAKSSDGRTVQANLALAESNATIATQIALALGDGSGYC